MQNGTGGGVDASRGSTALTDEVRWQANLHLLEKKDAKHYGVPASECRKFVLMDFPKANYGPDRPTLLLKRGVGGVLSPAEDGI